MKIILIVLIAIVLVSGCIGQTVDDSNGTADNGGVDDNSETDSDGTDQYSDAVVITESDEDAVILEEKEWLKANACTDADGIMGSNEPGTPEENWSFHGPTLVEENGHKYHTYNTMCSDQNYRYFVFQVDDLE